MLKYPLGICIGLHQNSNLAMEALIIHPAKSLLSLHFEVIVFLEKKNGNELLRRRLGVPQKVKS